MGDQLAPSAFGSSLRKKPRFEHVRTKILVRLCTISASSHAQAEVRDTRSFCRGYSSAGLMIARMGVSVMTLSAIKLCVVTVPL